MRAAIVACALGFALAADVPLAMESLNSSCSGSWGADFHSLPPGFAITNECLYEPAGVDFQPGQVK